MNESDVFLPMLLAAGALGGGGLGSQDGGGLGFHQGIVLAWNEQTGQNTIQINGSNFTDLRVLQSSDSIMLAPGDSVGVLRHQSSYFVLGRISAPGAGSALRIRSALVTTQENTSSTSYTDLATVGPVIQDVYVGTRRTCLVIMSAEIFASASIGAMGFAVSGASTIAASASNAARGAFSGVDTIGSTCTAFQVLTAASGLNSGLNTFTAKYVFGAFGAGTNAGFRFRNLFVFPL